MKTTESVRITDVGPRDGLQNQHFSVSTRQKSELIESLWAAGLPAIEVTSFVSAKAVPQMADADVLMSALQVPAGRSASALVPNQRGLDRAIAAGCREIAVVLSATDTLNRKNINMSLAEAIQVATGTVQAARSHGLATRAYIAAAFACPYEGAVSPEQTLRLAELVATAGADEVVVADTIGAASPLDVERVLTLLGSRLSIAKIGLHFHDTRGMALANAWQGLQMGVRRFDASVAGLGGCPFAPGAAGNLATEDLALLCAQSGFETGIDFDRLAETVDLVGRLAGPDACGRSMRWYRSALTRLDRPPLTTFRGP